MVSPQKDLFNEYFHFREKTEPPVVFHRWSLITCLGAYLGRQFWLPFGEGRIFPNFYTMLIGHPGSRKSTAIKLAKKLTSAAGYSSYSAEKTSKEKFLLDLEGAAEDETFSKMGGKRNGRAGTKIDTLAELFGEDKDAAPKEPREVFIVADEFNEFVGSGNLEFLSLLGMLWDWDDEGANYNFRLKNSKSVSIYQPTISILSGNTHAGFVEAFPPQAIGQGFLSRLILVYGEPSGKKISDPPPPDEELRKELVARFKHIKEYVRGPAVQTPEAKFAIDVIYKTWKPLDDGRFTHYGGRRDTHLRKLCLIAAAARGSTTIEEKDVVYANTMLTYAEADMPKALGEFGKSKDSDIASKIMTKLYETNEPVTTMQLLAIVGKDLDKASQLGELLVKLQNSGQIQQVTSAAGVKGYMPKQKQIDSKLMYVDFSLLKEYELKYGKQIRRVK